MRKKSMVPERNGESTRTKHRAEKCDLKPVDAEKPKIQWHCRDQKKKRPKEKGADNQFASGERNFWKHSIGLLSGGFFSGSAQMNNSFRGLRPSHQYVQPRLILSGSPI